MLLSGNGYRESLRRYQPRVYVDGRLIESVAGEPSLAPGLRDAGATPASTEMALFEWLKHADHPAFRTVLPLGKEY